MTAAERPHRIGLALGCLHVSTGLYVLLGVCLLLISADGPAGLPPAVGVPLAAFSLAIGAGVEVVAAGPRRRKFWAWVAGLCVFGTYATSLFLPLGVLGLWGLLDEGSRAAFGVGGPPARPRGDRPAPGRLPRGS